MLSIKALTLAIPFGPQQKTIDCCDVCCGSSLESEEFVEMSITQELSNLGKTGDVECECCVNNCEKYKETYIYAKLKFTNTGNVKTPNGIEIEVETVLNFFNSRTECDACELFWDCKQSTNGQILIDEPDLNIDDSFMKRTEKQFSWTSQGPTFSNKYSTKGGDAPTGEMGKIYFFWHLYAGNLPIVWVNELDARALCRNPIVVNNKTKCEGGYSYNCKTDGCLTHITITVRNIPKYFLQYIELEQGVQGTLPF